MSNIEGDCTRYVYVLVNEGLRLIYVGQTKQPERRAQQHRSLADGGAETFLYRTMRKVGADSFLFRLLHSVDTANEATQAEQLWIDHLRASGEWLVLNDASAAPPKSDRKFKDAVTCYMSRLVAETAIGEVLPTIAETTRATQACGKTVQRCYEALRDAGRIATNGGGSRYRRVA